MSDDDTLNAAPAQADTAVEQAVPDSAVPAETTTEATPAPADTAAPTTEERLWAKKYKTPETMEVGHVELERYATQLAQHNKVLERQLNQAIPANPALPAKPVYTPEQLEGAKIDLLDKMADARVQGDATKAREYASQIVWCDRELMNQRMAQTTQTSRAQAAESTLMQEVAGVVQQYQAELVPGNALHDKAAHLLDSYLAMGMANNAITQSHAIVMAAQLLGKTQSATEQNTRRELSKNIAGAMKGAVVAGAGQASTGAPVSPNFMDPSWTDEKFEAYQKQHGLR